MTTDNFAAARERVIAGFSSKRWTAPHSLGAQRPGGIEGTKIARAQAAQKRDGPAQVPAGQPKAGSGPGRVAGNSLSLAAGSGALLGRQAGFLDLVQQGAVADAQHFRGALAIPARLLERLEDHVAFRL